MKNRLLLEKIAIVDDNPKQYIDQNLLKLGSRPSIDNLEQAQHALLMGRAYLITGKHDLALSMLNQALQFLNENGDKMSLFQCYSNLGILYREERQYELALKSLNKSYNIAFELDDFSFIILSLVNIASVYSSLDNTGKSIELLEKGLQYKDKLKNSKILGDLYNNYAFVLMSENKFKEALKYLHDAYDVYRQIYGDKIQTNILIVLSNIGEAYALSGDFDNAEVYINKALKFAEENQIAFIESDCHKNLSLIYEEQGDYKAALYHHKRHVSINEGIAAEHVKEELDALKTKLEEESKRSEEEINMLRNVELKSKTDELEKTLKNLSNISEIGRNLTSSMDIAQIYEILKRSVYELMPVDIFGLALLDADEGLIIYKYFEEGGKPLPLMEISVENRVSLASYCIVHEEDVFIKDFESEYEKYLPNAYYVSIGNNRDKSTQCVVYCRLIIEGKCIGFITLQSYEAYAYTEVDFEVIKALASYVAIAISNAQKKNIIIEKAKELEYLSLNDPLTGLSNRRFFTQMSEQLSESAESLPLGLIIGDMNYLKEINDNYGHQLGDLYLSEVSNILKKHADGYPVFRLGGDEFAILVKNASEAKLTAMIDAIKDDCKKALIGPKPLSISLGFELKYFGSDMMDDVFAMAESKMYMEKNRIKRISGN